MGSPLQAALARLWASVLHVRRVGPDDDFFILGGDSLSGARLLAGVKSVFGIDLSLRALFHNASRFASALAFRSNPRPTIRALPWSGLHDRRSRSLCHRTH